MFLKTLGPYNKCKERIVDPAPIRDEMLCSYREASKSSMVSLNSS
jgi:hypothetical protein